MNSKSFKRMGVITIVALYILILVGGIVRSAGAGMGCPDWPKCFGEWVPPTNESQLPADYVQTMVEERKAKNERIQKLLSRFGVKYSFAESASHLLYEGTSFNFQKAWVEYLNRLVGVLIGFFIFLSTVFSVKFVRKKGYRRVFVWTLVAFILVMVQGFLGSIVVSTNLLPGMITWHMLLALVIVCCVVYAVYCAGLTKGNGVTGSRSSLNIITVVTLLITLVQLILGTQVRESIDSLHAAGVARDNWTSELGINFFVHRSFSWLVLLTNGMLVFRLFRSTFSLNWVVSLLGSIVLIEFLSGLAMAVFDVPAFLQPIHLLLGTLSIGVQFLVLLELNKNRIYKRVSGEKGVSIV